MKKVSYVDIAIANETIKTTDIKGKDYAEVNQRIKAFRMIYPQGSIATHIESLQDGVVVMSCEVREENGNLLGKAYAYEKEDSSYINKTSFIENCCTSCTGRALGYCGFGIDVSVASAEEVQNAINNQVTIETEEQARELEIKFGKHKGKTIGKLYDEKDNYLEWLFDNTNDENIKKAISILTGLVDHTSEETKEIVNEMAIQEGQKQRLKDKYKDNLDQLQLEIIAKGKKKLSELTYEDAENLLKGE